MVPAFRGSFEESLQSESVPQKAVEHEEAVLVGRFKV